MQTVTTGSRMPCFNVREKTKSRRLRLGFVSSVLPGYVIEPTTGTALSFINSVLGRSAANKYFAIECSDI